MPDTTPIPIAFIDTETLGLHPDAPIWDFACIKRFPDGYEDTTEFRIQHQPGDWVGKLMDAPHGEQFVADYLRRYNRDDAATESDAAVMINMLTRGAVIVGCNPSFDLERITKLLIRNGMTPGWHYRPLCVTTMAAGYLHGAAAQAIAEAVDWGETPDPALTNRTLPPPWSSDELSLGIGVRSEDYPRHTAMGDVRWTVAQWDTITGRTTP